MPLCRLCQGSTQALFSQTILSKHKVDYFRCDCCDLVQTETPYWLEDAYQDSIARLDVGAMSRNRMCEQVVLVLSHLLKKSNLSSCLDFGGGPGTFTRLMRDQGLNFEWADKYSRNIYARGFEGDVSKRYSLLTAFEVFEHLNEVGKETRELFGPGHPFLLVGTVLHTQIHSQWWYLSPQTGQHIAFFSQKTMGFIAERYGYDAITAPAFTLFVKKGQPLSTFRRSLIGYCLKRPTRLAKWVSLLGWLRPFGSLSQSDFSRLSAKAH